MKGLWLQDGRLQLRDDLPAPGPARDEALLAVSLAGICGTDLELVKGYYPFVGIPGHEFVGVVERCPCRPDLEGQRVVGEINASCGQCDTCLAGRFRHCEQRTVLGIVGRNGVLASHAVLPVRCLHPVPPALPDRAAVFCEPLAAALRIPEQVAVGPGSRVLLVGAGRLGQLIARVLQLTGCQLLVAERDPGKLDLLRASGVAILAPGEPLPERIMDLVVDAGGSPETFHLARRAVRPGGTIVAKSTYRGRLELDYSALVVDEITLLGSRCGPFAPALRLLEQGLVDPTSLVEATYPLQQGVEAFEHAARPGALKVLVQM